MAITLVFAFCFSEAIASQTSHQISNSSFPNDLLTLNPATNPDQVITPAQQSLRDYSDAALTEIFTGGPLFWLLLSVASIFASVVWLTGRVLGFYEKTLFLAIALFNRSFYSLIRKIVMHPTINKLFSQ